MATRIADHVHQLKDDNRKMRQMFANICHDLRTPLTIIQGSLETLQIKGEYLSAEERRKVMAVASAQIRFLGQLIESVFSLSKLLSPEFRLQPELFSLAELMQDIAIKFSVKAGERGIAIRMFGVERHVRVMADLLLIERVLDNLIGNALCHAESADEITLQLIDNGARIDVVVSDNGPGLSSFLREYLSGTGLRPHPYAGAAARGAGLGLSIVRRILELHTSRLELLSTATSGTSLRFSLHKAEDEKTLQEASGESSVLAHEPDIASAA